VDDNPIGRPPPFDERDDGAGVLTGKEHIVWPATIGVPIAHVPFDQGRYDHRIDEVLQR
jgi:hypothetical protein